MTKSFQIGFFKTDQPLIIQLGSRIELKSSETEFFMNVIEFKKVWVWRFVQYFYSKDLVFKAKFLRHYAEIVSNTNSLNNDYVDFHKT